jgi:hypothetical protein
VSENVVDLARYREANAPHSSGQARCTACAHEFVAVAPVPLDSPWLECPSCGTMRALYKGDYDIPDGESVWQCKCGNQLFYVLASGFVYCPGCGRDQKFP